MEGAIQSLNLTQIGGQIGQIEVTVNMQGLWQLSIGSWGRLVGAENPWPNTMMQLFVRITLRIDVFHYNIAMDVNRRTDLISFRSDIKQNSLPQGQIGVRPQKWIIIRVLFNIFRCCVCLNVFSRLKPSSSGNKMNIIVPLTIQLYHCVFNLLKPVMMLFRWRTNKHLLHTGALWSLHTWMLYARNDEGCTKRSL